MDACCAVPETWMRVVLFQGRGCVLCCSRDVDACCAVLEKLMNTDDIKTSFQEHSDEIKAGLTNKTASVRVQWLRNVRMHFVNLLSCTCCTLLTRYFKEITQLVNVTYRHVF